MRTVSTPTTKRPGGRRPGDSGTKDAILEAARTQFAERGYDGASLRNIAAAAGVDPALIRHFFGDKATLFAVSIADNAELLEGVLAAFAGGQRGLGKRVTGAYLGLWEDPSTRTTVEALVRSAMTSQAAADVIGALVVGRARASTGADDRQIERIALAMSHLLGTASARYIFRIRPLADMPFDRLVDEVAPAIQRYLTGRWR